MNQPCGCCAGIEIVTPESEVNRPGLGAIAYRVGTNATFLESMLARLSTLYLDVPSADGSGALERIYPLQRLTARELNDPSIALLDAWAMVADVLSFYQERIANEGYLGTATERLSILELARLVGYKLRPGVSASVFMAFSVSDGFQGAIPAGTRAQSIPGSGELPQFFETSSELVARDTWNDLGVRLTRPQVITLSANPLTGQPAAIDQGTDAATRDTLFFKGISTKLNAGDALLIVSGDGPGQQVLRFAKTVNAQAEQKRTEVILQEASRSPQTGGREGSQGAVAALHSALDSFIADASTMFMGSDLAAQTAGTLSGLIQQAQTAASASEIASIVQGAIPRIQEKHDIAIKRKFARLEPWLADILDELSSLAQELPLLDDRGSGAGGSNLATAPVEAVASALGNLSGILRRLALPPSLQPVNTLRLTRNVPQTFAPQSDTAPRLLTAFNPAIAGTLYKAWAGIEPAPNRIQVFAMRTKAAPFGNNAPLQVNISNGTLQTPTEWALSSTDSDNPANLWMDSVNNKIVPGNWVAIIRTDSNAPSQPQIIQVTGVQSVSRADYGMSARVTQLAVAQAWLVNPPIPPGSKTPDLSILRQATLYAQPEELDLEEEPLDRDVEGGAIELDGLYDGLYSGRWIIVSGNRTDVTNSSRSTGSTQVTGNELVMIAAVGQGTSKQSCRPLTFNSVPFSDVYYVTAPDDSGDRLVVAKPNPGLTQFLTNVPLPDNPGGNQQICDPVELAPGLYANAYIPKAAERAGDFSAFAGLLMDPATNQAFSPAGVIPLGRIDPTDRNNPAAVWAWRITDMASFDDTPHTTLVLASPLAYTYDAQTVTIYGNVAKATHGQTAGEVLGNGKGSQSLQKFTLGQMPLTYLSDPSPAGAKSTLVVRVNEVEWHEAGNLAALGPRDRGYFTETDNADKTSVIFGTGVHGARLPTGNSNVKATYRYGIGKAGNVAAGQISQLVSQPLGLKGVINPLRASGGADRDSRDQARGNAPLAVEALDRLVSVEDYAWFARTYAGIGKASSARLSDGRRLIVHITIAGVDDIPIDPSSDLYQNLVQSLGQNGDPYLPIQVSPRLLRLLVISAGVKVSPGYAWESVEPNIRAALLSTFGFNLRDLGQSAFLSEALSAAQNVEGVSYVNVTTFDSVAENVTAEQLTALAGTLELRPVVTAGLDEVDPSETDPAKRISPAELAILTPDIPDTLILNQITNAKAGEGQTLELAILPKTAPPTAFRLR